MDGSSSSDDDGNGDEDDDEDEISDRVDHDDLEDGEFRSTEVEVVMESNLEEVASSLADVPMEVDDRRTKSDRHGEPQGSGINIHDKLQSEFESLGNNEYINVVEQDDVLDCEDIAVAVNRNGDTGGSLNELLDNLANIGCFGPFPNNVGVKDIQMGEQEVNFDSAQDKRRKILRKTDNIPTDLTDSPAPHASLDINKCLIPTQVPLLDTDVDSLSSSSEIRNTVQYTGILG